MNPQDIEQLVKESKIQLQGIDLIEFSFSSQDAPSETHIFEVNVESKVNKKDLNIVIITNIKILTSDKDKCLAKVVTGCRYLVDNLKEFIEKSNDDFEMPILLVDLLNSISLSTTRGIMFELFKGTFLHNYVLPIVNPKDFRVVDSTQETR